MVELANESGYLQNQDDLFFFRYKNIPVSPSIVLRKGAIVISALLLLICLSLVLLMQSNLPATITIDELSTSYHITMLTLPPLIGLFYIGYIYLLCKTTTLQVSDTKLYLRTGILTPKRRVIPLDKITTIELSEGFLDNFFNTREIRLSTTDSQNLYLGIFPAKYARSLKEYFQIKNLKNM